MFKRFFPNLSPLTARILAVNAMPLIILVGSILYMGGYQDRLIQNEIESLTKEARQFAAALGEGAVVSSDDERDLLSPELAATIARRLVETTETRTRLFDIRGAQFTDVMIVHGKPSIESEPLPPPGQSMQMTLQQRWQYFAGWFRGLFWARPFPLYAESNEPVSMDYPIVENALDGDAGSEVWMMQNGHLLLGVAVPIQRYKGVLGAVFLTRDGTKVEEAVHAVRMDIVSLFLATLLLTTLLSLYLARTIARPLQALSRAAEDMKIGKTGTLQWQSSLPDLSARHDEIGDLSAALRTMVQALATRMQAIESFAADVAHEIKNPLTSLHSAVETAQKIKDPEKQQRLMAVIAHDVQRLDRLITDISLASRIEAELVRAKTKPISIAAMMDMVSGLYKPMAGDLIDKERPSVVVMPAPGLENLRILGAESRLAQVFQNLIGNALSFSPEGHAVRVKLDVAESNKVHISVMDDGPGIPPNKLEAIFDRFYSERPQGEEFGKHSGLGLSIAKQIVEAHNGRIWAENILDESGTIRGAKFIVELPLYEA